jgi:hypothetical protein
MHEQLKASAILNLTQLKSALVQTDTADYTKPLNILSGSTIGMHVRHIVEFYQCLIKASATETLNYDGRDRNLQIENDIDFASNVIHESCKFIDSISENKSIVLLTSQDLDDTIMEIPTNIFREMTYLIEHTIHHMAIIKMAYISSLSNILLPENFGVAYSTIKHKQLVHSNISAD